MMSKFFKRKAFIPIWVIVFGLFSFFGPVNVATGTLLLTVGIVAAGIMLILWRDPTPTIGEVLHHVDQSRTRRS
jgi:hypothetical protein